MTLWLVMSEHGKVDAALSVREIILFLHFLEWGVGAQGFLTLGEIFLIHMFVLHFGPFTPVVTQIGGAVGSIVEWRMVFMELLIELKYENGNDDEND